MYTGCRVGFLMWCARPSTRSQMDGCGFSQHKTKTKVELPILPALQKTLDASPTGDLTFLITEKATPTARRVLEIGLRDRCNEAGLPSVPPTA